MLADQKKIFKRPSENKRYACTSISLVKIVSDYKKYLHHLTSTISQYFFFV